MDNIDKVNNKVKNRKTDVALSYLCSDCGENVTTTLSEIFRLDDNGLCFSTRCKKCRDEKNARFAKK